MDIKFLDGNYSPSEEIWSQISLCTELRGTLLELAKVDKPLLGKRIFYEVMVDLSKLQDSLQDLRKVASRERVNILLETAGDNT